MEKHMTEIRAKVLSLMIEHGISYVEIKMTCNSDKTNVRGNIFLDEDYLEEDEESDEDILGKLGLK